MTNISITKKDMKDFGNICSITVSQALSDEIKFSCKKFLLLIPFKGKDHRYLIYTLDSVYIRHLIILQFKN
jgi:hypothetical protein